jgi:hypothetical protein
MKTVLKQPLVHFLLLGVGLFVLFDQTAGGGESAATAVVVDRNALVTFMQQRAKSFDEARYGQQLDRMPEPERQRLIADYVREEVLYREALALGLDRDDYLIRKRLVQNLEFVTQGFVEAETELSDQDVARYFEQHRGDYKLAPFITFTHVFFDAGRHGAEKARTLATGKLRQLQAERAPFSDAAKHGEHFPYHRNYVERTDEYVRGHFGAKMADQLFALGTGTWQGPFNSDYGAHLVLVTAMEAGRSLGLEEVVENVRRNATRTALQERTEEAIRTVIDAYDVRVTYEPSPKSAREEEGAE